MRVLYESRLAGWFTEAERLAANAEAELRASSNSVDTELSRTFDAFRDRERGILAASTARAPGSRAQGPRAPGARLADPGFVEVAGELIYFPRIEAAWSFLMDREVIDFETWQELSELHQRRAFTIAQVNSITALERARDLLATATDEGWSQQTYGAALDQEFARLGVTGPEPWQVDRVFRTETSRARSEAHDQIMADPVVGTVFPFARYDAIRDTRVETDYGSSHLVLDDWVFLQRDPIWSSGEQPMRPPRRPNCRCSRTALSIRQFLNQWRRGEIKYGSGAIEIVDPDSGERVQIPRHPDLFETLLEAGVPYTGLFRGAEVYELPT